MTLELMQIRAAKYGGKCLSTCYINNNTKLIWQCKREHVFQMIPRGVINHWCPSCAREICKKCNSIKKCKNEKFYCIKCKYTRNKKYKLKNKELIAIYNKIKLKETSIRVSNWKKNRRKTDPAYKLRGLISCQIYKGLKLQSSTKRGKSCWDYLGYSQEDLKCHLESKFESWMTWENHGKYIKSKWKENDSTTWTWEIDHIIPHSSLPYRSMEDENFKKCWALENLRPLAAKQNLLDGVNRTRHL